MNERLVKCTTFVSFDGRVELSAFHQKPDRYRHLEVDLGSQSRIARGGGYSFSAASFGENVLVQEMTCFDRFLAFDSARKTVRVESGMPLGKLMGWAMQRGLYFPVLPGYPAITVGGCVAADAHGKNPWKDGTFSDWVIEINIFHPSRGYMRLSRSENLEAFALTCGGFGLTGIIADVTLQLVDLPAKALAVHKIPITSLSEAARKLGECSDKADFIYSWHDGTRRGNSFGEGVVFIGNWMPDVQAKIIPLPHDKVMTARSRGRMPFSLWNGLTASMANRLFAAMSAIKPVEVQGVAKATFPFAFNTLYHTFYGKKGFAEAQLLVGAQAVEGFFEKLRDLVEQHNAPLMLMSLKRFRGRQKALGMSGEGYLVALNFCRTKGLDDFLGRLDQLMVEVGGQPNLSKDSRISGDVAAKTLPNYNEFKYRLREFDPMRIYRSELSDRINI